MGTLTIVIRLRLKKFSVTPKSKSLAYRHRSRASVRSSAQHSLLRLRPSVRRLLPSHHRPNHWLRALPPAPRLRLHLYEAASVAGSAASCPVPVLLSPAP